MEDDEKVWILRGATVENQDNHSAIITKVVSVKDEETKESELYQKRSIWAHIKRLIWQ